jgi:filamentous hemagglutinin family protein
MNHIYRLVWSRVANSWVAVAENAKGHGKSVSARKLIAAAAALIGGSLLTSSVYAANAADASIAAGNGSAVVTTAGTTTTINQASQRVVVDWTALSTAANEALIFNQPNAAAIALNRITGSSPSTFLGSLSANGQVYILNPNGVLFGAGAQVNVGGLVASTMSMNTADFMNGGSTFTQNPNATGEVVNKGTINAASGGYIALLGRTVRNEGTINAPLGTVALGAGSNITLTFSGNSLVHMQVDESVFNTLAENGGLIQADGGLVVMTAGAANSLLASVVNNTGTVEARTVQNHEGTITLLGGMEAGTVNVAGTLDASAQNGGNGGAIETSAATVNVADSARIDTRAPQGLMGSWLVDPTDFTVAASGGNITGAALSAELKLSNITIDTVHTTGSQAGDINVNDAVNWSSNSANASSSTLTLNAANNININAPMTWGVSGTPGNSATTGALAMNAGGIINIGAAMNAFWRAPLTMNTAASSTDHPSTVNVNLLPNAGGFAGAVNFYSDAGVTAAGGAGLLAINGNNYTVISDVTPGSGVGVAGDTGTDSLQGMQNNPGGYYALGSNIDASDTANWNGGTGFSAIVHDENVYFTGMFDGLGHTVTGLTEKPASAFSAGLFGSSNGTVRNVGMIGTNILGTAISGADYSGALVGLNLGIVSNSYAIDPSYVINPTTGGMVSGAVISGRNEVGGLVGLNRNIIDNSYTNVFMPTGPSRVGSYGVGGLAGNNYGIIRNSYAMGPVRSTGNAGGLVGSNVYGTITNSHASGPVWSRGGGGGGLVGYAGQNSSIDNSYATGNISGSGVLGGLVGRNYGAISNSYATGYGINTGVIGTIGGLVGANGSSGSISNSYATGNVNGAGSTGNPVNNIGGLIGQNSGTIDGSHATGAVSGYGNFVGGLVGNNGAGSISNSYATGDVTANGIVVGGLLGSANAGLVITNSYALGNVSGNGSVGGLIGQDSGALLINSFYNGQGATINGLTLDTGAAYTAGFLYGAQFVDWVTHGMTLNAANYAADLTPVAGGYYTINSLQGLKDMLGFSGMVNGPKFRLAANLDLSSLPGFYFSYFGGTLDGAGHTISNFSISSGMDRTGMFSILSATANISNLGLTNVNVNGRNAIGGLAGINLGTISNSYSTGSVTGTGNDVGGLVGINQGAISGSSSAANVNGAGNQFAVSNDVGGLVGANNGGTIAGSSTSGSVTATGNDSGGLVGINSGTITGSSSSASVISSSANAGVLVGYNNAGSTIDSSFTTGNASGINDVGGIAGLNDGAINNSHASGSVNGTTAVGGLAGASSGAIGNSYALGSVNSIGDNAGGLVGINMGSIGASYASGTVAGEDNVGGLAGANNGSITASHAGGNVSGRDNVGGLTGQNLGSAQGATIDASYATGTVSGRNGVGGLVGQNNAIGGNGGAAGLGFDGDVGSNGYAVINNSYATGAVTGQDDVGGLAGQNINSNGNVGATSNTHNAGGAGGIGASSVTNSYATNSVIGINNVGGLVGTNTGAVRASHADGIVTGQDDVGGLAGTNGGAISASFASGNVSGRDNVGGLTGQNAGVGETGSNSTDGDPSSQYWWHNGGNRTASIDTSYASGTVSGRNNVGGLTGENSGNGGNGGSGNFELAGAAGGNGYGVINNSYSVGAVTGQNNVGGLIGQNTSNVGNVGADVGGAGGDGASSVANSYSIGSVTSTGSSVGALAGNISGNSTFTNNFYNSDINPALTGFGSSSGNVADVAGTVWGMNTVAMQVSANFISATGTSAVTDHSGNGGVNPGWDLVNAGGGSGVTWFMTDGQSTPLLDAALIRLVITANDAGTTYNGTAYSGNNGVTYSITPNLAYLSGSLTYTGSSQGAVNAGGYTITPGGLYSSAGQNGYVITFVNGNLTIAPAPITISSAPVTKQYDGTTSVTGGSYIVGGTLYANAGNGNIQDSLSGGLYTFASPDVLGAGNSTVNVSGVTVNDGNGGRNYAVTYAANTASTITPLVPVVPVVPVVPDATPAVQTQTQSTVSNVAASAGQGVSQAGGQSGPVNSPPPAAGDGSGGSASAAGITISLGGNGSSLLIQSDSANQ